MSVITEVEPGPAVFLDRDGTVIEERHFLSDPDGVALLPTAAEAIALLNSLKIPVIVVTNQAGVARGYFPESQIAKVHQRLDEQLADLGAKIQRYDYCPHHPTEGLGEYAVDCSCRKPKPGMLLRAATELGVDLSRSLMVGDRLGDLQAGASAGCATALVRTGYGKSVESGIDLVPLRCLGTFDLIGDAVAAWLGQSIRS